jgi:predicted N-acyltransferase
MQLQVLQGLGGIDAEEWDALAGGSPPLRHAFLHALHESGSACPETGWVPRYLSVWKGCRLVGAMPAYEKYHSYGEFVFDWAWAEAYQRHGLRYYPKIVVAVPFTPIPGPRILACDPAVRALLVEGLETLRRKADASSVNCLFPQEADIPDFTRAGLMVREGVQFHWINRGYRDFGDFLDSLNHDKRKKIRQERRKVAEAGVTFETRIGAEIRPSDWLFFERCYRETYRQHRSTPYLNHEFMVRLAHAMRDQVLMVIASRNGDPIACALNLVGQGRAYGRYWGSLEPVSGLHFETCYYQSIDWCIRNGIEAFEGGAQGEHKLARGLMPVRTVSLHRLHDGRFAKAVGDFLQREGRGIEHYRSELEEHGPFRKG